MYIKSKEFPTPISSDYIKTSDLEGFVEITGLISTGFNKLKASLVDIKNGLIKRENNVHTSGFISTMINKRKDKKFELIYDTELGVPIGLVGYLSDIAKDISDNVKHIKLLNDTIDDSVRKISALINSTDKTSFSIDMSVINTIMVNGKSLHGIVSNILDTDSRVDVRTIGSLFKNGNDIDNVLNIMNNVNNHVKYQDLVEIKNKLSHVDDLITTIVQNGDKYSKPKIEELGMMLDGLLSYANGVASIVYLKVSVNDIMDNVNDIL